jgi:tRNA(Ile)-lysidine synthase
MKYLIAVSGGIDSVVLLDMLVRQNKHELIVAHIDHGIRPDSAADARFVQGLALQYRLPYVGKREELGSEAGEDRARHARYGFLFAAAAKHSATVVTAHHADDVIETIAINLVRGTGWRGLAVLDSPVVVRPLLRFTKQDVRRYAHERRLEWVEDSTNAEAKYLRNRVRRRLPVSLTLDARQSLRELRDEQLDIKAAIDQEAGRLLEAGERLSRYFFSCAETDAAMELLRHAVVQRARRSPTRPQLERALVAIKAARPQTRYELGGGVTLNFTKRNFTVQTA